MLRRAAGILSVVMNLLGLGPPVVYPSQALQMAVTHISLKLRREITAGDVDQEWNLEQSNERGHLGQVQRETRKHPRPMANWDAECSRRGGTWGEQGTCNILQCATERQSERKMDWGPQEPPGWDNVEAFCKNPQGSSITLKVTTRSLKRISPSKSLERSFLVDQWLKSLK